MSDEIETIDKNQKSWAAWKREAERLQAIIDDMALVAMDSEPVSQNEPISFDEWSRKCALQITLCYPDFREKAQYIWDSARETQQLAPAPVVSADLLHTAASAIEDLLTTKDRTGAGVWFDLPFRLRSAANAQPAPVVPVENHIGSKNALDAIVSFIKGKSNPTVKCYEEVSEQLFKDNCHGIHSHVIEYILKLGEELEDLRAEQAEMQPVPVVPVCTCPSGDGSLRWPCPVHPGNSPVIPDGWTGNEKANAALMMLDRIETVDPVDDDRIDGIKRIVRELAAAPHDTPALNSVQSVVTVPGKWIPVSEQKPDCWCRTCRPVVLNDMRFVVCPDCGNKRCPRANDHRNACTGSNEPGQGGSAYPDTPREVKP